MNAFILQFLTGLQLGAIYALIALGLTLICVAAWLATQINAAQPFLSVSTVTRHAGDWYPDSTAAGTAPPGCQLQGEGAANGIGSGHVARFTRAHCEHPLTAPRVFALGDSHTIAYLGLF